MIFIRYFHLFAFQLLSSFLVSPVKTLYPLPHSLCSPTHPLQLPGSGIPLHWGIKPSWDQGPLLPLMTNTAILCYKYSWSHESLRVYSLVGGLVPGSSGGYWLVHIVVPPMGLQIPSALWTFKMEIKIRGPDKSFHPESTLPSWL